MLHSIVIPAYNEEKRVGKTLKEYASYFDKAGAKYELVVVCDGCKDNTAGIVRSMASENPRIKLFEVDHRLGKGGGVYYGFSKCTGDTIGFSDADNAIVPGEYNKLLTALSDSDFAMASRRKEGSETVIPEAKKSWIFAMKVASRVFNLLVNIIFWMRVKDTQCGAKVMKREVYEKIKNDLNVKGFEFDVELIWRVKKSGFRIKEVGIKWFHDLDSKSSLKNSARMLFSLLRRRLKN